MEMFFKVLAVWLGALLTFCIFSFLYKDNPFYKVAEQIFVGLSAGYWFVYTVFNILIPNLFDKLGSDFSGNAILLVPAALGLMMLAQISNKSSWLSRYPIALMVGTTAGIGFVRTLSSDVINQLTATIANPFAAATTVDAIGQTLLIIGTIAGITYFYFSIRHKGSFGASARLGIYFLMVSFGAAFGYTAMARISLLIGRLEFLLGDWLHLIN